MIKKLDSIFEKINFGDIISRNDRYILSKPRNSWDMNYSVYDTEERTIYLIDIGDIQDNEQDLNEYGGIMFSDLKSLDMEQIKESAWKTKEY